MVTPIDDVFDRFLAWVAWHLPRRLAGYCYLRVMSEASCGKFAQKEMGTITAQEAYLAWFEEYEPDELDEL